MADRTLCSAFQQASRRYRNTTPLIRFSRHGHFPQTQSGGQRPTNRFHGVRCAWRGPMGSRASTRCRVGATTLAPANSASPVYGMSPCSASASPRTWYAWRSNEKTGAGRAWTGRFESRVPFVCDTSPCANRSISVLRILGRTACSEGLRSARARESDTPRCAGRATQGLPRRCSAPQPLWIDDAVSAGGRKPSSKPVETGGPEHWSRLRNYVPVAVLLRGLLCAEGVSAAQNG